MANQTPGVALPGWPEGVPMPFQGQSSQKFFYSSDIDYPVRLKVLSLDGPAALRDYYITAQLWADDRAVGPPVTTGFGKTATIQQYNWNSVMNFAAKYNALPVTAQIALTIWDISKPGEHVPFGGTTVSLFSKRNILRKGRQKLHVWEGVEADGSSRSSTPGKLYRSNPLDEIEKLIKKWTQGRLGHVEWLDKMASRAIEKINLQTDQRHQERLTLFLEMPEFEHPIVFLPQTLPMPTSHALQQARNAALAGRPTATVAAPLVQAFDYDPDVLAGSAAERKHRTLTRARKRAPLDAAQRSLKPNSMDRQILNRIVAYPLTKQLTEIEMEKLWNFRVYLKSNRKALTKFVRCIEWTQSWQAEEALRLMNQWESIDLEDALELLSGTFARFPGVRAFAVNRLEAASDDDLTLFLMQLVQALRYDKLAMSINNPASGTPEAGLISELATFLIDRAVSNDVIGTYFYWYLKVETLAPTGSSTHQDVDFYHRILKEFMTRLEHADPPKETLLAQFQQQEEMVETCAKICSGLKVSKLPRQKKIEKLRETLREGAENGSLLHFAPMPLPMDPSVLFEGVHPDASIFNSAMNPIRLNLKLIPERPMSIMFKLGDDLRQDQLVVQLISLMDNLLKKENLDLKLTPYRVLATSRSLGMIELVPNSANIADVLKKYEGDLLKYLKHYNPAPSPADRSKSSTTISSATSKDTAALATAKDSSSGSVKLPGSAAGNGNANTSSSGKDTELDTYGVAPEALNNFVRSCAGYCVITYLLGIGDRHLDNLLITHDGKLFHIDFGFIMGRDPKPLPPPMKLCKEMVFGMGGHDSPHYVQFKSFACEAYNILRKSGNLILSLVSLMVDSNLEDIEGMRSILKLQEKFKLDLSDEEASAHLQNLITESVRAIVPSLMEKVHQWAKYWRN
jgi:phosphatidylinositol 3-kinase